jgi:hypothetical protein
MTLLWRCGTCDWRGVESEIMRAENPFGGDELQGCPNCGEVNGFVNVCDEPGCTKDAECGWPSEAGYRRTCGDHWKK